ncbi:ABC-three component system middle component 6 [Nostoc sp. C052]
MILPTKHISTSHSLLGVGATILEQLYQPRTVSSLWSSCCYHARSCHI